MREFFAQHPVLSVAGVLVAVAAVVTVAVVVAGQRPSANPPEDSPGPEPSDSASGDPCGDATVTVTSASELTEALDSASPGDVISLAAGTYTGNFRATASGTPDEPIVLCGSAESVLDGGGVEHGYVLHLDGASYWHVFGFTVNNGQKGIMADSIHDTILEGLTVSHIGDEAIHLRANSTDNTVVGNTISETGLREAKFGEGIYIGSAESNWCDITDCEPDRSDNNLIEDNTISGTTAESIDIKEGTSGGILRHNSFDGAAMVEADSWVDVKGNDWLIEANAGTDSPLDGFQTHEILDGWGLGNVFRANTAAVNGPGFGFSLTPALTNVVECDNTASGAGQGTSNVTCSTR